LSRNEKVEQYKKADPQIQWFKVLDWS